MRAKVAVVTVSGKAYFLVTNELRRRNIPFLSIVPGEPIPSEVKAVITTEKEKPIVKHEKVLIYDVETEPEVIGEAVVRVLQGKEAYEKIVIGIDPGEVFGLAVIADGKVIETSNCFNEIEVLKDVKGIVKNINPASTSITIKVGSGVPAYKDLIETMDNELPAYVNLEVIGEAGTTRNINHAKHRRGLRDIASAIRIAGRSGHIYPRRKTDEQNS